ncbi:hypothetical protein Golob_011421, partial [Gossypium lobatum]|nr:hypothetical protein [Gossypium lobatum]
LRHDCEEPHTDQHALLAFKHQIIDSHNILANSWTTNNSVCNWAGVSCAAKHQRVKSFGSFQHGSYWNHPSAVRKPVVPSLSLFESQQFPRPFSVGVGTIESSEAH